MGEEEGEEGEEWEGEVDGNENTDDDVHDSFSKTYSIVLEVLVWFGYECPRDEAAWTM